MNQRVGGSENGVQENDWLVALGRFQINMADKANHFLHYLHVTAVYLFLCQLSIKFISCTYLYFISYLDQCVHVHEYSEWTITTISISLRTTHHTRHCNCKCDVFVIPPIWFIVSTYNINVRTNYGCKLENICGANPYAWTTRSQRGISIIQ